MSKLRWLSSAFVLSLAACASKHEESPASDAVFQDDAKPEASIEKEAIDLIYKDKGGGLGARRAIRMANSPIAIEDGRFLNAVYFVRANDSSWQSISQKIYGSEDRADLLKSWNKTSKLVPGTLLYYNSPFRPNDGKKLLSFAEDFGMQLENYTVVSGDWLSKVALARYAHVDSWKEISALNPNISNPDRIEIGQVIKLQPANIDTTQAIAEFKKNLSKPSVTPPQTTSTGTLSNRESDELPPPPPATSEVEQVEQNDQPAATAEASSNPSTAPPAKWKSMLTEYLDYILLVAGVGILGGALFVIRRRRLAAQELASFDNNRDAPTNLADYTRSQNS